jgi:hypothetical protein
MERFLGKKYKLDRVENFDAVMIELGMNSVLRKIAKTLSTVVQLTKNNDEYSLNTTILLMTTSQKFKINVEKDVTTLDGRKIREVFSKESDNVLIERQIGEKTMTITRTFYDDQLIVVAEIAGVIF